MTQIKGVYSESVNLMLHFCLDCSTDQKVHEKASQYILFVSMALTLPAVFTACFLGSWSDKRGRKGPMVVASIGSSLDALIILAAIHWKLPLYVFMIGIHGIFFVNSFFPLLFSSKEG